jgi:ferredoxin
MADRLKRDGAGFDIHCAGRRRAGMAFVQRLTADHGERLALYAGDEGRRPDLAAVIAARPPGTQFYACGPDRMIAAVQDLARDLPDGMLRFEHFSAAAGAGGGAHDESFEVELVDSNLTVVVPRDGTLLQSLRAVGIDVPSDCEEGLCGTCELEVLGGAIDHRDRVLTAVERRGERRMMSCCSRARAGSQLKIAK